MEKAGLRKPGSEPLRLGPPSRMRILPRPEEGLRAVIDQARGQAPRAEAVAARWVESTRPVWTWFAREWRRLGTLAAILLIAGILVHALYGANGMVIYRQKRAEMKALQSEVERLQKENGRYVGQIRSLKSDPAAIEKEAREQLRYARPGEIVLVAPDTPQKAATSRAKNEK